MITTSILYVKPSSRDRAVVQFQHLYFLHNKTLTQTPNFFMKNISFFAALKFVIDLMS